ncbi:cytochrome P450, partial [Obelidium mucronatum]
MLSPSRRNGKQIPGPSGLPILGSMLDFANSTNSGKQHEYLTSINQTYGPIAKITILQYPMIVTSDRELIHRAHTETSNFYRDEEGEKCVVGLLDHALFVMASGENWKRHRKFIQPAFAPPQLRYALQVSIRETNRLIDFWEAKLDAEGSLVVDLNRELTCLALDLIGHIAFSQDFRAVEEHHQGKVSETHEIMQEVGRLFGERFANVPFTWYFVGIAPSSPRVVRVRKFVENMVSEILKVKRASIKDGTATRKHMDVLDRLLVLDSESNQQKFTDAEIIGESVGFLVAGHETTSTSLTFITMEIARHPAVQQKLQAEIATVLDKIDHHLTMENLAEFKYLDHVIKETQRLHSVVGALVRTTINPVEHKGYVIPAKTPIVMNLQDLHLDANLWEDPLVWNPDRWSGTHPVLANSFVPFADGPHNCIGQKLALIEMKVFAFHWQLVADQEIEFVTYTTYGLKNGLQVKLTRK